MNWLCEECSSTLKLLDPRYHCAKCYCSCEQPICSECRLCRSPFEAMAAPLSFEGAAATLIHSFKHHSQYRLAEGLAAFMIAAVDPLNWPLPDLIVPIPLSLSQLFSLNYNPSALIAEALSSFLNRPTSSILRKRATFSLKRKVDIENKVIWLIDDVIRSGETMRASALALLKGNPAKVYGLAPCRVL